MKQRTIYNEKRRTYTTFMIHDNFILQETYYLPFKTQGKKPEPIKIDEDYIKTFEKILKRIEEGKSEEVAPVMKEYHLAKKNVIPEYILIHPDQNRSLCPFVDFFPREKAYSLDCIYLKPQNEEDLEIIWQNTKAIESLFHTLGFTNKK